MEATRSTGSDRVKRLRWASGEVAEDLKALSEEDVRDASYFRSVRLAARLQIEQGAVETFGPAGEAPWFGHGADEEFDAVEGERHLRSAVDQFAKCLPERERVGLAITTRQVCEIRQDALNACASRAL